MIFCRAALPMSLVAKTSCLLLLLLLGVGCEPASPPEPLAGGNDDTDAPACLYYATAEIDILPLTEFAPADGEPQIHAYVSLLDSFGSQIKAPGKFRFELYQHVQRSPQTTDGHSATRFDRYAGAHR